MPTTIVTDSTCDVTADLARQHGIEIVPLPTGPAIAVNAGPGAVAIFSAEG